MVKRNITKEVRTYLLNHPSVLDCLSLGLINHSALARLLSAELGVKKFDAVLAASRRFGLAKRSPTTYAKNIQKIIATMQVRVTNGIAVVIARTPQDMDAASLMQRTIRKSRGRCNIITSDEVMTIIVTEQHLPIARSILRANITTIMTDLAQIQLIFDQKIETTPGVVAHIYGLLAHHGINVREEMSCWTDLLLVVDENELPRALSVLPRVKK